MAVSWATTTMATTLTLEAAAAAAGAAGAGGGGLFDGIDNGGAGGAGGDGIGGPLFADDVRWEAMQDLRLDDGDGGIGGDDFGGMGMGMAGVMADAFVLADALYFSVGWLRCNFVVVVRAGGAKKNAYTCQGVRKIFFSDSHSGVCSQEHLPFREVRTWYKVYESH